MLSEIIVGQVHRFVPAKTAFDKINEAPLAFSPVEQVIVCDIVGNVVAIAERAIVHRVIDEVLFVEVGVILHSLIPKLRYWPGRADPDL